MAVNIYDLQIENAKELIKIYSKRSEQLKKAILSIVKSGGDSSTLTREKKRIDDILKALRKELKELTAAQIEYSYTRGQDTTKKDYKALKIGLLIGAILPDKGKKELTKTYHSHIDWAIDRMQSKLNAFVRKDFSTVNQAVKNVESLAYNRLGLIVPSNLEKTKDLNGLAKFFETQLKARDIFRVPYYHRTGSKAGKVFSHVRTENYCKMLARTLTAEADRKAVTDMVEQTFKPYGGDLVEFVAKTKTQAASCDDCYHLLGSILSINGLSKGYITIAEAEAEYDIFHPNCIHTLEVTDKVLKQYKYLGIEIPKQTEYKYLSKDNSQQSRQQAIDITNSEEKAIKEYTDTMDYININAYLRGNISEISKSKAKTIRKITDALNKSSLPQNTMLYRGVKSDFIEKVFNNSDLADLIGDVYDNIPTEKDIERVKDALLGKTYIDKGFVSTSRYRFKAFDNSPIMLEINAPKGIHALAVDKISGKKESEVLINKGYKYQIRNINLKENKDKKLQWNFIVDFAD